MLQKDLAEAGMADRKQHNRTTMMQRPQYPHCVPQAIPSETAA